MGGESIEHRAPGGVENGDGTGLGVLGWTLRWSVADPFENATYGDQDVRNKGDEIEDSEDKCLAHHNRTDSNPRAKNYTWCRWTSDRYHSIQGRSRKGVKKMIDLTGT